MKNKTRQLKKYLVIFLVIALCLEFSNGQASQAGDSDQTMSLSGGGSYSTYKSKIALSNDTGISYFYSLKILGGQSENILVEAYGSSSNVAFALNNSSIKSQELIFYFGFNGSWLELAAGLGNQQIQATLPESQKFDSYSRVAGAFSKVEFDLNRGSNIYFSIKANYPIETKEQEKQTLKVGLKTVGELGAIFPLTKKSLKLTSGLSYSAQPISLNGKGGTETLISPFLSLNFGFGM